jgi:DNA-binding Lrp family transcriptional regulator
MTEADTNPPAAAEAENAAAQAENAAAQAEDGAAQAEHPDADVLDDLDRELLNAVQWDFPLEARPFAVLAERLGISEPEVRARVAKVKETGVLRQLSAIFDTRALGYSSALVAAKVDPDHIDEAAAVISEHPGVSHNYKRNHDYNLWYTVAVPPGDSIAEHIDVLHRESGSRITRTLPTIKLYKIGVKLDMTGQTAANAKVEVLEHERPERKAEMPAPDLSELEHATIRVVQHDLANVERPFGVYAEQIGMGTTEDDVLDVLRSLKERKLMRRFAAVMNHRSAGFKANAMGVWAVPEERLDEIGPQMAGFAAVSHCYRRPTYDDWPYSVFTMVHGRTARDCEATIDAIRSETGVDEYCLLWSIKEYKKVRLEYFTPDWDGWYAKHAAPA